MVYSGRLARLGLLLPLVAFGCRAAPGAQAPEAFGGVHSPLTYRPARAAVAPRIDGILDDEVWKQATPDPRFYSRSSKPYGLPATQPTTVQAAYDEQYFYVAFRCGYSNHDERDDGVPPEELTLVAQSESVAVHLDARHDHSNGRVFIVGRSGARADVDITNNARTPNMTWRGIWDVAVNTSEDSWTAEYRIPWGTVGLPPHDEPFEIGVNFRRQVPRAEEYAMWALAPANAQGYPPSGFGHLVGMSRVSPGQRLYLAPYVSVSLRSDASEQLPRLRDFTGTSGNAAIYGGLYGRLRPVGPLQIDVTMNPDFSQVSPDQAVANLDRYELFFPEVRPFFSEDKARFEFGTDTDLLFYSRRLGLRRESAGFVEVPILYGTKAIVRASGTEAAAMNVGLTEPRGGAGLDDNVTVVRVNQLFGQGTRIGMIFLNRAGEVSSYRAAGLDGAIAVIDEHLLLSGFLARTQTDGAEAGGAGNAAINWSSQEFSAGLSYLDVSEAFDTQLGYFAQSGVRKTAATAAFTPQVHSDLVREVALRGTVVRVRSQEDALVFDRGTVAMTGTLLDFATMEVSVAPSVEAVSEAFTIAGDRITIAPGRYTGTILALAASSPPRRTLEVSLGYTEGELFDGYRRSPYGKLGLNIGRFTGSTLYRLYLVHVGDQSLTGHEVSGRALFAFTPELRSALALEANTLDPSATAQLVNTYTFGDLSSVALVLSQSADSTEQWLENPERKAILSFAYGFTPF